MLCDVLKLRLIINKYSNILTICLFDNPLLFSLYFRHGFSSESKFVKGNRVNRSSSNIQLLFVANVEIDYTNLLKMSE